MVLSKRLQRIAELVTGRCVLDVGCDHGLLSKYLLQNGLCERVIASDISQKSLQKLDWTNEHLCKRVGDGLSVIDGRDGVDTIVVAGMGGETICGILQGNTFCADLIVSPQSKVHLVRTQIAKMGYALVEDFVLLDGKYYTILKAKWCPESTPVYDDNQLLYGVYYTKDKVQKQQLSQRYQSLCQKKNEKANQKAQQLACVLQSFEL
ncbi:MAG: class I SAM-dependent methyltransferase [Firmicutes bacterium]|nr:class I SAM-dependent methyltransferase [Bacillota bacterium]